jgi:hypothetical protein
MEHKYVSVPFVFGTIATEVVPPAFVKEILTPPIQTPLITVKAKQTVPEEITEGYAEGNK